MLHQAQMSSWISKNAIRLLIGIVVLYTVVVGGLSAVKYAHFSYDAIDLGIYGQVMHQTAHGRLFELTIHPHSYLGDHVELILLAITPIYLLFSSPVALLIVQVLAVAITALLLFFIAKRRLSPAWSLFAVVAFLLNPTILNAIFFEFHALLLALPLLAGAVLCYLQKKFWPFLLLAIISLTVREDVSLVIFMFGIMALLDRRTWRWRLTPLLIAVAWFTGAMLLSGSLNPQGSYKFLALYSWLGDGYGSILTTALLQPWRVLIHLVSIGNIFLALGLLLPVVGLSLLRPKWLLPALPIALQLMLTTISATILLQTHYTVIMVLFVYVAAIHAGAAAFTKTTNTKQRPYLTALQPYRGLMTIIVVTAVLYAAVTFSPLPAAVAEFLPNDREKIDAILRSDAVALVALDDAVVASFAFLPHLSQRDELYSLHYAFLGKKQFSSKDFLIPNTVDSLVIDFRDFVIYDIQSQNISSYREQFPTGAERIRRLITDNDLGLVSIADSIGVYRRGAEDVAPLVEYGASPTLQPDPIKITDSLSLISWEPLPTGNPRLVGLTLLWLRNGPVNETYHLNATIEKTSGVSQQLGYYPLGYGLYPIGEWPTSRLIATNYWFAVPPELQTANHDLQLQVVELDGYMGLDGTRSTELRITNETIIGEPLVIPLPPDRS